MYTLYCLSHLQNFNYLLFVYFIDHLHDLKIPHEMKQVFTVPNFRKKKKFKPAEVTLNVVVDNLLNDLQKKENEKIEEQKKIELRALKRNEQKIQKEKELLIKKSFLKRKKELNFKKKNLASQIGMIKKKLKSEVKEENKNELQNVLIDLSTDLESVENKLIQEEISALQSQVKIKQEKM